MGDMADWQLEQMVIPDEDGWDEEQELDERKREAHRLAQQRYRARMKARRRGPRD